MRTIHKMTRWKSMHWDCWKCGIRTVGYVETMTDSYQYLYNYPCGHPHSAVDTDPELTPAELALVALMEDKQ